MESISSKKSKVKSKKWGHLQFRDDENLNLSNIKTWSTFNFTCIDLCFFIEKDKFLCNADIYDGEPFGGHRRDLRFTAKIELDKSFMKKIEDYIENSFKFYLDDQYDIYLEKKKNNFINDLKIKILA